jgi:hypothetical protein
MIGLGRELATAALRGLWIWQLMMMMTRQRRMVRGGETVCP